MKKIPLAASLLFVSMAAALYLLFDVRGFKAEDKIAWRKKELEIRSRLLSIPILLYHNIDGKGVFSIDLPVLRSHFQLFRERGVSVIALSELIGRIDNPVPFGEKTVVITFDDGYPSMYTKLLPLVREFRYPVTLFVHTDAVGDNGKGGLDWEKLRRLDRNGIDIQAHSKSHRDLTLLTPRSGGGRDELYREMVLSKKVLELHLGKTVTFFAFPYGRYDLDLIALASSAGYRRVFSTDYGSNIITRNNYCLRRQHVKRSYSLDDIEKFIK